MVIGFTTASLALHGLILGLPSPDNSPPEPLEPSGSRQNLAIDVTVLPPDGLNPEVTPESSAAAAPRSPTARPITEERTPPPAPNPVPTAPPPSVSSPAPAVPPPVTTALSTAPAATGNEPEPSSTPPSPDEPSLPATNPDAIAELPPEPGVPTITEPEPLTPPTLAERLHDPSAYQYDGSRKNLDEAVAPMELMNWVVPGQVLPSKLSPLELPYQLGDTCLDTPPMRGLMVVVLNAEGTFLRGPEMISSTGYAVLDEQALAQVQDDDYSWPQEDAAKAYSIDVAVQYPAVCQ